MIKQISKRFILIIFIFTIIFMILGLTFKPKANTIQNKHSIIKYKQETSYNKDNNIKSLTINFVPAEIIDQQTYYPYCEYQINNPKKITFTDCVEPKLLPNTEWATELSRDDGERGEIITLSGIKYRFYDKVPISELAYLNNVTLYGFPPSDFYHPDQEIEYNFKNEFCFPSVNRDLSLTHLPLSFEIEILPNSFLKISKVNFSLEAFHNNYDVFLKIDTKELGLDFNKLYNQEIIKYFENDLELSEKELKKYWSDYDKLPKKRWFYMTQYFGDSRALNSDFLKTDIFNGKLIEKKLFLMIRIPMKLLKNLNDKNYIIIPSIETLNNSLRKKINVMSCFSILGLKNRVSWSDGIFYDLTQKDAEYLFDRVKDDNGQYSYNGYIKLKNNYDNVFFSDTSFEQFCYDNIFGCLDGKIKKKDNHIFLFKEKAFEQLYNKVYSNNKGSHNIEKFSNLSIKDETNIDFKTKIYDYIGSQIKDKQLFGLNEFDYTLKATDNLYNIDNEEAIIKQLNKEYKEFLDNLKLASKTYNIKLKTNKDFLADKYIPFSKDTWEPDMDTEFNLVFSKTIYEIKLKNTYIDLENTYNFYTENIDTFKFSDNISVIEKDHQKENDIPFNAILENNLLNLYKLEGNFKLNDEPIKYKVINFPCELQGNKNWYLIKTKTISNEELLKHYKLNSLDGDEYEYEIIHNPMLASGDNVVNDFLKIKVKSKHNPKEYTFNIPVYRDGKSLVEFKKDTQDGLFYSQTNPQLIKQIFYSNKYKMNLDKVKDRFLEANIGYKRVEVSTVDKDKYLKSNNVVYKQVYIAKDENQPDSEQISHIINYIVKQGIDKKVFISNAGTNRYIFHRAKTETLSKEEFQKLITALFSGQGTIDKIELKEIVLKKKTITIQEQEDAIKRYLENPNSEVKERIFLTVYRNSQPEDKVIQLENIEDDYFYTKKDDNDTKPTIPEEDNTKPTEEDNKTTNPVEDNKTKPDTNNKKNTILEDIKFYATKYKKWLIIGGSTFGGLILLSILIALIRKKKNRK